LESDVSRNVRFLLLQALQGPYGHKNSMLQPLDLRFQYLLRILNALGKPNGWGALAHEIDAQAQAMKGESILP
jgi:hypothetical protein